MEMWGIARVDGCSWFHLAYPGVGMGMVPPSKDAAPPTCRIRSRGCYSSILLGFSRYVLVV